MIRFENQLHGASAYMQDLNFDRLRLFLFDAKATILDLEFNYIIIYTFTSLVALF